MDRIHVCVWQKRKSGKKDNKIKMETNKTKLN